MNYKKGSKVEERFRKMFRGEKTDWDEVDFQTKTTLYEVKSCAIINHGYNSNHRRKFSKRMHRNILSHKLGRFHIITDNHIMLYIRALQQQKKAKYIFAIHWGNKCIWRVADWKELALTNDRDYFDLAIPSIFKHELISDE